MVKKAEITKAKEELFKIAETCRLCPWECGVNRLKGEKGYCRAGSQIKIAAAIPHFYEEPPISGERGAGNIFFSHCTMSCIYCQNYEISRHNRGKEITAEELADIILELQQKKVHSIGLVSGAHFLPWILEALEIASENGFNLPLLYNTSGYERKEILKLLDGIIDIYLPDMRYARDNTAQKFSGAENYVEINRKAVHEMFRQTGNPVFDGKGIIRKGLIIRYLVLPGLSEESAELFRYIKNNISKDAFVSIMAQYFPAYRADEFPPLNRKITQAEYDAVIERFFDEGMHNGWMQELDSADKRYVPNFGE